MRCFLLVVLLGGLYLYSSSGWSKIIVKCGGTSCSPGDTVSSAEYTENSGPYVSGMLEMYSALYARTRSGYVMQLRGTTRYAGTIYHQNVASDFKLGRYMVVGRIPKGFMYFCVGIYSPKNSEYAFCDTSSNPEPPSCSISAPDILIDHGVLTVKEIDNHISKKTFDLQCNNDANVSLTFKNTNGVAGNITLGSYITSELSINGVKLTTSGGVLRRAISKNISYGFDIISTLHSSGGALSAGTYSGGGTLIMTVQ